MVDIYVIFHKLYLIFLNESLFLFHNCPQFSWKPSKGWSVFFFSLVQTANKPHTWLSVCVSLTTSSTLKDTYSTDSWIVGNLQSTTVQTSTIWRHEAEISPHRDRQTCTQRVPEKSRAHTPLWWNPFSKERHLRVWMSHTWMAGSLPTCTHTLDADQNLPNN